MEKSINVYFRTIFRRKCIKSEFKMIMPETKVFMTNTTEDRAHSMAEQLNDEMRLALMPVTVFMGIEAVFGLLGNLLILYVFLFHYHKCNFKFFALCLSFIDITSTLTTIPGAMVKQTFWYVYPIPLMCKIVTYFEEFTVCAYVLVFSLIAVDRYRKVCRPLAWQIKPSVAITLLIVLLMVSLFVTMPALFLGGTHTLLREIEGRSVTVTECNIDSDFVDTFFPGLYMMLLGIFVIVPSLGLVMIFNGHVIKSIRQLKQGKNGKGNNSNQQNIRVKVKAETVSDENISGQTQDIELEDINESTSFRSDNAIERDTGLSKQPKAEPKMTTTLSPKEKESTSAERRTRQTTLVLQILTLVFYLTFVLRVIMQFGFDRTSSKASIAVYWFFFHMYFINHAINPIVYILLDTKFRGVIKTKLRCCKTSRR